MAKKSILGPCYVKDSTAPYVKHLTYSLYYDYIIQPVLVPGWVVGHSNCQTHQGRGEEGQSESHLGDVGLLMGHLCDSCSIYRGIKFTHGFT